MNPAFLSTPKLSDNNDYLTFPSFENSQNQSFHDICNFLPPPTIGRIKSLILHDNIRQIFLLKDDANNAKYALGRKWLERYYIQADTNTVEIVGMTRCEAVAHDICHSLALITYASRESACWLEEDFEKCLKRYNADLLNAIETLRSMVHTLKSSAVPSQSTLHVLYTAYDVGSLCLAFHKHTLSFEGSTHKLQVKSNEKVLEVTASLLDELEQKTQIINKSLNESGWIDRVLSVINDDVRETVDEDFIEEWAGLVVESWKESAIGLSYLKKSYS